MFKSIKFIVKFLGFLLHFLAFYFDFPQISFCIIYTYNKVSICATSPDFWNKRKTPTGFPVGEFPF